MTMSFLVSMDEPRSMQREVPAFPHVRANAREFIWEEALHEGNYLVVHASPCGRCQSRANVYARVTGGGVNPVLRYAFEIEVDGQLLRDAWTWVDYSIGDISPNRQALIVSLEHAPAGIAVDVHTLIDGSRFLTRWLSIRNFSGRAVRLSRVFPMAGLIDCQEDGYELLKRDGGRGYRYGGFVNHRWGMEGQFLWQKMPLGTISLRDLATRWSPAFWCVRDEEYGRLAVIAAECTSPVQIDLTYGLAGGIGAMQSWSGSFAYFKLGHAGKAPVRILAPGEACETMRVHLGLFQGDLDEAVNGLYDHLRRSVMPITARSGRANVVEYNHTGYTFNAQITQDQLLQEVEVASAIGAELFLVDAGWFGPADKAWNDCTGDWRVNPLLGEHGLQAVFAAARERGMLCGLWMPQDWVDPGTPIFLEHPDWFHKGTRAPDLLNPQVEEYVFDTICSTVEKFALDCFRIDGGSSYIGESGHGDMGPEDVSWRYYDKLYALYERVQARFPDLILENCSGGAGRSDLGMMRRFAYTQVTDNWSPRDQIRILNGLTLALTPAQCMPLVGSLSMKQGDLEFMLHTALFGHFAASGAFPGMEAVNEPALDIWRRAVALYKEFVRPFLDNCLVYHHTPVQRLDEMGDWVVLEYVSADRDAAMVGFFRLSGDGPDTYTFESRGLDAGKSYAVTFEGRRQTATLSGRELCSQGLTVRIPSVLRSELLTIRSR